MRIIDLHCDALLKLAKNKKRSFTSCSEIETNYERLMKGRVKGQLFAIFIDPDTPYDKKYEKALEQIKLFHEEILGKHKKIVKISKWTDFDFLKEDEIGAALTLEGADAFGNDIEKLNHFYELGVLSIGLTWNNANLVCDGIGESRGAGLSDFGKKVVKLNNERKVLTDVSHISVKGFWDVIEEAQYPIATHSNSYTLCQHRRNLTDDQAKALFQKNGLIGIVFNPPFLSNTSKASISDIVRHIDYFCSLGGEKHLCLGSDFDGIIEFVENLDNASKYQNLINELLKFFTKEQVEGFAHRNFLQFIPR